MTIVFRCFCGKKLGSRPSAAGRQVKCPACGDMLTVPTPEPEPIPEPEVELEPIGSAGWSLSTDAEQAVPADAGLDRSKVGVVTDESEDYEWSRGSEDDVAPHGTHLPPRSLPTHQPDLPAPQVSAVAVPGLEPLPVREEKVWEYKILTQKDKWFSGKFDPAKLEEALNAYAKQGWRMRGMATASIPGIMGGARDELIFVLER